MVESARTSPAPPPSSIVTRGRDQMRRGMALRLVSTATGMLIGWQVGSLAGTTSDQPRNAIVGIVAGALVGLALSPWLVRRPYEAMRRRVAGMPAGDLLAALVGLVIGLGVAALLAYP